MDSTQAFEAERPRLLGLAARVLADHAEAEDVVQQAWLRLERTRSCNDVEIELAHRGETHDDVINAQDQHLKAAEKDGDAAHQAARDEMKARWRHPKRSLGWYRDMKQAFADLPED